MERGEIDLSAYDNRRYKPGGNRFTRAMWYFTNIVFFINPLNPFNGLKISLLRMFGAKIGRGVVVKPGVNIKYPWNLKIGDHSWIGERAWIDNLSKIVIGSNCCVSQGAMLLCGNHNYKKTTFDLITRQIILEDGTWIGAKAVVTLGVTCRSHSLLTVNSVAVSELQAYSIYQGNPAVRIKDRPVE